MKKALKRYEHVPLLPQVLEQMMAIRLTPQADEDEKWKLGNRPPLPRVALELLVHGILPPSVD